MKIKEIMVKVMGRDREMSRRKGRLETEGCEDKEKVFFFDVETKASVKECMGAKQLSRYILSFLRYDEYLIFF